MGVCLGASKLGLANEDSFRVKRKKIFHVEHDETLSRRHSSLPRSVLRGRRGFNKSRFISLFFLPEKCWKRWSIVESLESHNRLIEASFPDCVQQFNRINKRVWGNRGSQCRTFPHPYVPGILWESLDRLDRRCMNGRCLHGEASSCHSGYAAAGLRPSWYRDNEGSVSNRKPSSRQNIPKINKLYQKSISLYNIDF